MKDYEPSSLQHHACLVTRIRDLSHRLDPLATGSVVKRAGFDGVRAVLFDVYGTLFVSGSGDISIASDLSSEEAWTEAAMNAGIAGDLCTAAPRALRFLHAVIREKHESAKNLGITCPEVDIREVWRKVLGMLAEQRLVSSEATDSLIEKLAVEYECLVNPVWPMPDCYAVLKHFREQGVKLGIVSNAQFYTPLLFEALLGQPVADLGVERALCMYSYRIREAKPSVNLFKPILEVLQKTWGITPAETLYVGNDMLNDILPAAQLGCRTALFAGDRRSLRLRQDDERCRDLIPDAIVTSLRQLMEG
ncbi:MAG: HAD family hydrolase [Candidatus Pacebacteria bacterium]|nr:HAD family hydrolase [Candidatus Paceibacterota bacterium]